MSEQKTELRARDRWLLVAFFLGPMAVLSHLSLAYSLVPSACAGGSKLKLHLSALVFLLLAGIGALIGWRIYRRFAGEDAELWQERTRWLSVVVMALAVSSMIVIVAMEIPNLILRSCD